MPSEVPGALPRWQFSVLGWNVGGVDLFQLPKAVCESSRGRLEKDDLFLLQEVPREAEIIKSLQGGRWSHTEGRSNGEGQGYGTTQGHGAFFGSSTQLGVHGSRYDISSEGLSFGLGLRIFPQG